ncbi:MAG: DNA primase [Lachnospiraceae bacterium]|nr:DNA primase [Lachnospiraceae bacterium]
MFYSDELIEDIQNKNDIVDVVSEYVKLNKKGGTYFGLCPFHNEKTGSFSVSPNKQMFYCFGCGVGGSVYTFLMKYENATFQEAIKMLADRAGVSLPEVELSGEDKKKRELKNTLLDINKLAAKFYVYQLRNESGEIGRKYFANRNLSEETITKFGLGYSGKYADALYMYLKKQGYSDDILKETGLFTFKDAKVYDKFFNRVMFPIMDINSKVIGFGGRVMGDGEPKYLNSPETKVFDKSRNLYGLNQARSSRKPNIIICEGYMDVIALHQAGFNNAVASLGTAFTSGQASLLKRYTKEVLLTYDSDGAGVKAALRAIPMLKSVGMTVRVINMRPYKDPDEFIKNLGADEFQKRIDDAENYFIYEANALKNNYDMHNPQQTNDYYNEIAKRLLEFDDEIERTVYMESVSRECMIPLDILKKLVARLALTYTGEKEYVQPKSGNNKKNEKDDGVKKSQRLLLTWLIDDSLIYSKIKNIISEDDFTTPLYKEVARQLFEQLEENRLNPAKIINHFENEEEQNEVAKLFNTTLDSEMDIKEKEKAINDIVLKVKKNSLDNLSRNASDIETLQKIIIEQKNISNMHISLG